MLPHASCSIAIRRGFFAACLLAGQLPMAGAAPANYRIRHGDELTVLVHLEPDLDSQVRVQADGSIALPLAGVVSADGRTLDEVRSDVAARLRRFLVDPQVSVQVTAYARRAVHVIGEVNRPGPIAIPDETPLSLLDALSAAGGFTRRADVRSVFIRRRAREGETRIIEKNVGELLSRPGAHDIDLDDGDTVFVGERWF
jgi:polysaccharide export outer membrane protein